MSSITIDLDDFDIDDILEYLEDECKLKSNCNRTLILDFCQRMIDLEDLSAGQSQYLIEARTLDESVLIESFIEDHKLIEVL